MKRWAVYLTILAMFTVLSPAFAGSNKGGGYGKGGKNGSADTVPPSVTIDAPQATATVSGAIQVKGSATDNVGITGVTVAIDGGGFTAATGGSSWSEQIDTTALPNGSHTITARAKDLAGNVATTQIAVDVENTPPPAPTPPPPDTTAPSVRVGSPNAGATVGGSVTLTGTASDDTGLASVQARVDGDAWKTAGGTSNWSVAFDTTRFADGSHTITVRAADTSGNTGTASISLTFSNTVVSPPTDPTHMVTPEGVTIDVNSAGGWTAPQIYNLLKQSTLQLDLIGPTLTIKVQDTTGSSTTTSASGSGGVYTSFRATMYLKGVNSTFANQPESQIAHEYGHAWSLYHLYMTHGGDWSSYLNARWANTDGSVRLSGDSRLDSSYTWDRKEIIADDYRLLFGSALAVSERPTHMNIAIPEPADVTGLRSFLLNTWG